MGGVWGLRVDNQLHLARLLCNWEVRDIVTGLCCDFVILKRGKYTLHIVSLRSPPSKPLFSLLLSMSQRLNRF